MQKFNMPMSRSLVEEWHYHQSMMLLVNTNRRLRIHVRPQKDRGPHPLIDVAARGLDGRSRFYDSRAATGVQFIVHAVLLSQELCADIIIEAIQTIEWHDLTKFTFVCRHATHRSAGMALLLAILVYNNAEIFFYTERTQAEAIQFGMIHASY